MTKRAKQLQEYFLNLCIGMSIALFGLAAYHSFV